MGPLHLSNLDVRQLRMFIAVVENEGVSAAAYTLGASLTSVSRSLSELEQRLGMRLCQRGRSGFELTPQGADIYALAQRLVAELDEFEASVRVIGQAVKGRLRVGIIDNTLLNPAARLVHGLKQLCSAHPEIFFELTISTPPQIEVAIRERRLDIGISAQPSYLSPLEYVEAFAEEHRVYIARDHPLWGEITSSAAKGAAALPDGAPYIARRYKAPALDRIQQRYRLNPVATANSVEAAATMIAAGFGLGILPTHYARLLADYNIAEIPVPECPLNLPFYLVHRSDCAEEPTVKALRKLLMPTSPTPAQAVNRSSELAGSS